MLVKCPVHGDHDCSRFRSCWFCPPPVAQEKEEPAEQEPGDREQGRKKK